MSVRSERLEILVDLLFASCSSPLGGEDGSLECQRLRVGTGFTFPPITLENHGVVTNFEGDVLYPKIRASLTIYLGCPRSHRKVVWWLEEGSRNRAHGFLYLFKRDNDTRLERDGDSSRSEVDYN